MYDSLYDVLNFYTINDMKNMIPTAYFFFFASVLAVHSLPFSSKIYDFCMLIFVWQSSCCRSTEVPALIRSEPSVLSALCLVICNTRENVNQFEYLIMFLFCKL